MALRNLISWGDPLFRKKSRVVSRFDARLEALLDDMLETLKKAGGYGCAAVHMGILRRIVVIDEGNRPLVLINPQIMESSAETQEVMEGSIASGAPRGTVVRPKSVTVSGQDRRGEPITITGRDFLAATLCHEVDHLDGILFTDKTKGGDHYANSPY